MTGLAASPCANDDLHAWVCTEDDFELLLNADDGTPISLGSGHYGSVFKAKLKTGEIVAVKTFNHSPDEPLTGKFIDNVKREMRILAHLNSPYIVQLRGVCFEPESRIIMEYAEFGSLWRILQRDDTGEFSWYRRGRKIAMDIARGLIALHERGVKHFDIKSCNILLDSSWTAKICDVGIAKLSERSRTTAELGTWDWAAPEQLRNERCGTAADVYSFGVVLGEIISGNQPRRGSPPEIQCPKHCPAEVNALREACLESQPDRRPSAREILDRLGTIKSRGIKRRGMSEVAPSGQPKKQPKTEWQAAQQQEPEFGLEQWIELYEAESVARSMSDCTPAAAESALTEQQDTFVPIIGNFGWKPLAQLHVESQPEMTWDDMGACTGPLNFDLDELRMTLPLAVSKPSFPDSKGTHAIEADCMPPARALPFLSSFTAALERQTQEGLRSRWAYTQALFSSCHREGQIESMCGQRG